MNPVRRLVSRLAPRHARLAAELAAGLPERLPQAPIVVGVDGSDTDPPVLAWAARETALRGAELIIVHAWQPAQANRAPYAPPCALGQHEFQEAEARHLLKTAVETALSVAPRVAVRAIAVKGMTVPTLLEQARDAELLVLGRRCREQVVEPALGPVTRACVRRAECPVVTVAADVRCPHPAGEAPPRR